MKRLLFVFVQLLIVLSAFAQGSVKYASVKLNLREDSNSWSQVITVIPKGTAVTMAEDCDCEWIHVSYQGQTGYVYSKYLTKDKPAHVNSSTSIKHYTNSAGKRIQSPTHYNSAPAGATALCWDGTYSFSQSRRGTCSHHGGVKIWL
jgi:Uncharacterized protein with a bacterial SH3 domain homologue